MLTIAIPMAGNSFFFPESEHKFPKVFIEINGRPMIQLVLENLMKIRRDIRFLFVINEFDEKKYRLDNVLRMLTDNNCDIVTQRSSTKGAICSLLLGVKYLNHDNPILIANVDQIIDHDLNKLLSHFEENNADGGVSCFNSVHPQWSYARATENDLLVETAEKSPISRNAIAGLYYFRRGSDFVNASMKTIEKDRSLDGIFYTSLTFNEMILQNKKLLIYRIAPEEYHSFYSPNKITEYENHIQNV
ncbi:glycosyltransferase family 2 protein [Alphaproteobacteria bacterium]|nr:glycosyltransferase family 2 protein [Alphaproteobacteria bacterium]